ncbi:porin [Roseobacter sp. HKCCA2468]|uniref:porin n=1 Tax=Roseobacter sp. HKCCA2468 TaxID=3120342 RepID=UPI0030EE5B4D
MKKVLFATTALIATAGVASADITLTGSAAMGLTHANDRTTNDVELDFNIVGSGTADNGISFGAKVGVDNQVNGETSTPTGPAEDATAFVSGAFGTLTMGSVDPATDGMGVPDVGHQGAGADDAGETNKTAGSSADVNWAYSVNGLSVLVGYDSTTEDSSARVSFDVGTVALSLGVANNRNGAADTDTTTAIQASTTVGGIGLTAYYETFDDDSANTETDGVAVSASFALDDATTITAVYSDNDASTEASYGLGASMNLGGGLSLAGGMASSNDDTRWDLGLNMSF